MQGVEAMLDQVFLAASYGLGGDTPFTWPLVCTVSRVPGVLGLAGHPYTCITEVFSPKRRHPGRRTRHGMLLGSLSDEPNGMRIPQGMLWGMPHGMLYSMPYGMPHRTWRGMPHAA